MSMCSSLVPPLVSLSILHQTRYTACVHTTDFTGQTSWTPPQGVFVVPRQAEGEWWELADTSRGNRSYFYNTMTKQTQWARPGENQFVIPLGLIQVSTAIQVKGRYVADLDRTALLPIMVNDDPDISLSRQLNISKPTIPALRLFVVGVARIPSHP